MSSGTRGGSNDATLPLIASDGITSGTFNAESAQVMKLGVGVLGALDLVDNAHPLPVSAVIRGQSGGIIQKVTILTNANTAYPVPASAQVGRVAILIQASRSNTDSIFVGSASVTADYTATGGIELLPGQSFSDELAASVAVYAASPTAGQKVATFETA